MYDDLNCYGNVVYVMGKTRKFESNCMAPTLCNAWDTFIVGRGYENYKLTTVVWFFSLMENPIPSEVAIANMTWYTSCWWTFYYYHYYYTFSYWPFLETTDFTFIISSPKTWEKVHRGWINGKILPSWQIVHPFALCNQHHKHRYHTRQFNSISMIVVDL